MRKNQRVHPPCKRKCSSLNSLHLQLIPYNYSHPISQRWPNITTCGLGYLGKIDTVISGQQLGHEKLGMFAFRPCISEPKHRKINRQLVGYDRQCKHTLHTRCYSENWRRKHYLVLVFLKKRHRGPWFAEDSGIKNTAYAKIFLTKV